MVIYYVRHSYIINHHGLLIILYYSFGTIVSMVLLSKTSYYLKLGMNENESNKNDTSNHFP